jgi:hypothetical protein
VGHFEKWELAFVPFGVIEKIIINKMKQVFILDKTFDHYLYCNQTLS